MRPLPSFPGGRRAPRPTVAVATLSIATFLAFGGCHQRGAPAADAGGVTNPAGVTEAGGRSSIPLAESQITVRRSGGVAGTETEATVDGSRLTYAIVTRPICESSISCPPPSDAANGAIAADDARALFARVNREGVFELKDDYGISPTLRDGYVHELTLRIGDRTKTVRADDATQPPQLGRVEGEVLEAIRKARGR